MEMGGYLIAFARTDYSTRQLRRAAHYYTSRISPLHQFAGDSQPHPLNLIAYGAVSHLTLRDTHPVRRLVR